MGTPIFVGDFETGNLSQFPDQNNGYKNERSKVAVVTDKVRDGRYAMSATLYRDDWLQHEDGKDRKHVDILKKSGSVKYFEDRYYGFSIQIPSDVTIPSQGFIVTQWHDQKDAGAEVWKRPFLFLKAKSNGEWGAGINWDSNKTTTDIDVNSAGVWIGQAPKITKGAWTDFVVKLNPDYRENGNGEVQIWMRVGESSAWKQVGSYEGPIGYNDDNPGWWGGHGIYASEPPRSSSVDNSNWSTSIPYIKVYHDEYRIGQSFDDVAPDGSGTNPPPPTDNLTKYGTSGNDTLTGGSSGKFTLIGAGGDDTYIVDADDVITELPGGGVDTIQSSVSYTMTDNNVNNLTLTGSSAINGTGNSYNNVITGNSGNNILNGGAGIDTLIGGGGNDTYIVDSTTDILTELPGGGVDLIAASVSYTMSDNNINNLTLTGSNAINGTGNSYNNLITGNSANNILVGASGNDTLIGGGGSDRFRFNAKNTGIDQIEDFSISGGDRIEVSKSGFGASSTSQFQYNSSTGDLAFNSTVFVELDSGLAFQPSSHLVLI